jgi:hypothetical protein
MRLVASNISDAAQRNAIDARRCAAAGMESQNVFPSALTVGSATSTPGGSRSPRSKPANGRRREGQAISNLLHPASGAKAIGLAVRSLRAFLQRLRQSKEPPESNGRKRRLRRQLLNSRRLHACNVGGDKGRSFPPPPLENRLAKTCPSIIS